MTNIQPFRKGLAACVYCMFRWCWIMDKQMLDAYDKVIGTGTKAGKMAPMVRKAVTLT